MESVLISIKPKWCELIANGKKTIEVRKTRPKIETPFKCYIYCTKEKYKNEYLHTSNKNNRLLFWHNKGDCEIVCQPENTSYTAYTCCGKVIGEFVCDKITKIKCVSKLSPKFGEYDVFYNFSLYESCLSESKLLEYLGEPEIEVNKFYLSELEYKGYSWHISNLKIYDEPKSLGEFNHFSENYHFNPAVTRPPQSWCYVKESKGGKS